jgi:hypothetical protein
MVDDDDDLDVELDDELDEIIDEALDVGPEDDFKFAQSDDERRRCFVLTNVGADYGLDELVKIDHWIKTGEAPTKKLRPVN